MIKPQDSSRDLLDQGIDFEPRQVNLQLGRNVEIKCPEGMSWDKFMGMVNATKLLPIWESVDVEEIAPRFIMASEKPTGMSWADYIKSIKDKEL